MSDAIERMTGEFRAPHNGFQAAPGSIHNDEVASKLGFKGGTVPGSVHMDQICPTGASKVRTRRTASLSG